LVVGLGNPGRKYAKTRHNAGFMALEELVRRLGARLEEEDLFALGRASLDGTPVVLMEPLTFMNRSGQAVRETLRGREITPGHLIVMHDDLDIETGRLKIRMGGGSGGHRGVSSIIESIGTPDFIRIKMGIGRDPEMLPEDYVLKKFSKDELPLMEENIVQAADAVESILRDGLSRAMNTFNERA
jgi:PTH1 family peptidyl-tRNA hydrolase